MKRFVLHLFKYSMGVILLIGTHQLTAQQTGKQLSALQLVELHLQALADEEQRNQATVIEQEGEVMVSRLGKTQMYRFTRIATRAGKRLYALSNQLGGLLYKEVYDQQKGWWYDRGKVNDLEGPKLQTLRNRPFISPFMDSTYYQGQLIGLKVRKKGYTLSVKDPNDEIHTYTFDRDSYLLISEVYRDDLGVLNMVAYAGYQRQDGFMVPTTISWQRYIDTEDKPQKEQWDYRVESTEILTRHPQDPRFSPPN
jgi:hypothetical protein